MYEPATAISTAGGHASDVEEVKNFIATVRKQYTVRGVLYGGSVDEKNVGEYLSLPDVVGVVVGAASLSSEKFRKIIDAV
jgi:triosephosphate isomerase